MNEDPQDKPFWLVWNPVARAPTYRHDTAESAESEAKRLARLKPGDSFIVLQSVARFRILDVVKTDMRPDADEEFPF